MSSSTSKRSHRSGSDRGRHSAPKGSVPQNPASQASASSQDSISALEQMFSAYKAQVINMVLAELQAEAPAPENVLPCPFQRRNPMRYRSVKDPACNGRGFKDIADLRDHIKRAHSSKYGCHYCKERFQGRDNAVEDAEKSHRKKCKYYASKKVCDVSVHKPEVMNPDQDKRYFKLDFRRLKGYSPDDKQYEQLWEICKAIWPEYEQPEVFERLDLRNNIDVIHVSRLSNIMDDAIGTVDVNQFLLSISPSVSQYASSSSRASYDASPSRSSFSNSPSRSSFSNSPTRPSHGSPANRTSYDELPSQPYYPEPVPQYNDLANLYAVPQPAQYAEKNVRDSAYGSGGSDDVNCYQHGNAQLGEQMLTDGDVDPDYASSMDRSMQLSGISARDGMSVVSPGYYGAGMEEDDILMMGALVGGEGGGFYCDDA